MRSRLLLIACALALAPRCHARDIVIDTDAGFDDLRAIIACLGAPEGRVLVVTTVTGSARAAAGADTCRRLLAALGRGGVPVVVGASAPGADASGPPWRAMSEGLVAALRQRGAVGPASALEATAQCLRDHESVEMLCLGPLTNVAALAAQHPRLLRRVRCLWFQGTPPDVPCPDWNTAADMPAARAVFAGAVPVASVPSAARAGQFDVALLRRAARQRSRGTVLLRRLSSLPRVSPLVAAGHLGLWDDTCAALMLRPGLATWRRSGHIATAAEVQADAALADLCGYWGVEGRKPAG